MCIKKMEKSVFKRIFHFKLFKNVINGILACMKYKINLFDFSSYYKQVFLRHLSNHVFDTK